jgi:hypothetical protein
VIRRAVGLVIVVGAIHWLLAQRGREDRVEADLATGEAVIGWREIRGSGSTEHPGGGTARRPSPTRRSDSGMMRHEEASQ